MALGDILSTPKHCRPWVHFHGYLQYNGPLEKTQNLKSRSANTYKCTNIIENLLTERGFKIQGTPGQGLIFFKLFFFF